MCGNSYPHPEGKAAEQDYSILALSCVVKTVCHKHNSRSIFRGLETGNRRITLPTMTILAKLLVTTMCVTPGPEEHGSSLRRNMGYSWISRIGCNTSCT